jgi:hypothetical protein
MGKKFNASEFLDFASSFNTIEDDWELRDYFSDDDSFIISGKFTIFKKGFLDSI